MFTPIHYFEIMGLLPDPVHPCRTIFSRFLSGESSLHSNLTLDQADLKLCVFLSTSERLAYCYSLQRDKRVDMEWEYEG